MDKPRVEFEIGQGDEAWGTFTVELEPERAPQTVENFLAYARDGFYAGTIFHRVIPHFMVQGGGHTPDGAIKPGKRPPVSNEAKTGLSNEVGVIAMARTSEPHSATSQFFINTADNKFLDHPGQDGWGYCAFGRVVAGMEVVERIRDVETRGGDSGENSQPVNPPVVRAVRVL